MQTEGALDDDELGGHLLAAQRVLDECRRERTPLPLDRVGEFAEALEAVRETYQVDRLSRSLNGAEEIENALASLKRAATDFSGALAKYGQAGMPGSSYIRSAADQWVEDQQRRVREIRSNIEVSLKVHKLDFSKDYEQIARMRRHNQVIAEEARALEEHIDFASHHPMPGTLRVLGRGAWLLSVWIEEAFRIDADRRQAEGCGWIDEVPDDEGLSANDRLIGQSIPDLYAKFFGNSGLRTSRIKKVDGQKSEAAGPVVEFALAVLKEFSVVSSQTGEPIGSIRVAEILKYRGPRRRKRSHKTKSATRA